MMSVHHGDGLDREHSAKTSMRLRWHCTFKNLLERYNLTEEPSTRVGKKRATISNTIRLLKLPADSDVL